MKKILSMVFAALFVLTVLTGCGKDSTTASVDVNKLCQDLQGTITSEVKEVNADIIASTFWIEADKVDECVAALNSGANAPEVVVLKAKDSKYLDDVEELFKTRIAERSKLFADYNAPEAEKYDNALIKKAGSYMVFCVTDDTDAAEKILKEAGF